MTSDLLDVIFQHDELADLDRAERRLALRALVREHVGPHAVPDLVPALADAIDGFGPLTPLLSDPLVTDVLVNSPEDIWVERAGCLERTDVRFATAADLDAWVGRVVGDAGVRIDASRPIADARLADGSRLHVVLPPVAPHGPLVSIRRFPETPATLEGLCAAGMMSDAERDLLLACVRDRRTVVISGGTGTGKTTLLACLLGHVGANERVVLIEETPELRPACAHAVSLIARPANIEGKGEVDLAALVRAALRMRPDRIVVGEIRGAEALVALAAMSTGHQGSMTTLHAGSATDALDRFAALASASGIRIEHPVLSDQVVRAVDVVVHLARDDTGLRRIAEIVGSP